MDADDAHAIVTEPLLESASGREEDMQSEMTSSGPFHRVPQAILAFCGESLFIYQPMACNSINRFCLYGWIFVK